MFRNRTGAALFDTVEAPPLVLDLDVELLFAELEQLLRDVGTLRLASACAPTPGGARAEPDRRRWSGRRPPAARPTQRSPPPLR